MGNISILFIYFWLMGVLSIVFLIASCDKEE